MCRESVARWRHGSGEFYLYDWNVDKREYIRLLREYDLNRDPTALARYVGVVGI